MGRKSKVIDLTKVEKTELQNGYKYSKSPNFSRRCHIVSLKNQGKTFQEIADIFGITRPPVHNWCNSYLEKGITGLKTKKDQERKSILDKTKDESIIKVTV
jgi:transposase